MKKNKFLIFIFLFLIIFVFVYISVSNANRNEVDTSKVYNGEINKANNSAILLDRLEGDKVLLSPINVNNNLAILYNGSDSKTFDIFSMYFDSSIEDVNKKLNNISFVSEVVKNDSVSEYYEELMKELFDRGFDKLDITRINSLLKEDKAKLYLLLSKINLTYLKLNGESDFKLKDIKKYTIKENEYNNTIINNLLRIVLDSYEEYINHNVISSSNYFFYNKNKIGFNEKFYKDIKYATFIEVKTGNKKEVIKEHTGNINLDDRIYNSNLIMVNSFDFYYKWEQEFSSTYNEDREFKNEDGSFTVVEMMKGITDTYISNDKAYGFIKSFDNNRYSFVGVIPKAGVKPSNIDLESLIEGKEDRNVYIEIPKLEINYSFSIKDIMKDNCIYNDFDYRKMVTKLDSYEDIFDYHLKISELGTYDDKYKNNSIETFTMGSDYLNVSLDKPFIYLIIDNETNDVLLIGKVANV